MEPGYSFLSSNRSFSFGFVPWQVTWLRYFSQVVWKHRALWVNTSVSVYWETGACLTSKAVEYNLSLSAEITTYFRKILSYNYCCSIIRCRRAKRQMDMMTAVTREQVEVSVGTTQTRLVCLSWCSDSIRPSSSWVRVHYKVVNLAMALTNHHNEVVTKLWNH